VFFHSFHNTFSQWLFPKFFTVGASQIWLQGEDGVLPMAGYALLGVFFFVVMRRRGQSWQALAGDALAENGRPSAVGSASIAESAMTTPLSPLRSSPTVAQRRPHD